MLGLRGNDVLLALRVELESHQQLRRLPLHAPVWASLYLRDAFNCHIVGFGCSRGVDDLLGVGTCSTPYMSDDTTFNSRRLRTNQISNVVAGILCDGFRFPSVRVRAGVRIAIPATGLNIATTHQRKLGICTAVDWYNYSLFSHERNHGVQDSRVHRRGRLEDRHYTPRRMNHSIVPAYRGRVGAPL